MTGASDMIVKRRYAFIHQDVDRHGNVRVFFRRRAGEKKIRIREKIGTLEFERRHEELLAQAEVGTFRPEPSTEPKSHTLRWLGVKWIGSTEFQQLDPRTQQVTRLILESMYLEPIAPGAKETFGDCPLSRFGAKAVGILMDRKAATPAAANNRLKRLRSLFKWAMLPRYADFGVMANPARDVAKLAPKRKGGFPVWRPQDLDKFEAHYPVGAQARLALALLMFTGARRSDVVRLGWPMARDDELSWVQHKGRNKNPVEVTIRMLPELRAVINATPVCGTKTFLVTQYGRAFTAEGFGNKMAEWCKEAGLAGLNSHGVRKAAAVRMAERGASAHVLMATFGWLDIKQAELYTRSAERRRLGIGNTYLLGTDAGQKIPTFDPSTPSVGKFDAKN
jgi:integrase